MLAHGDKAGPHQYYWAMQQRRGPPPVRLVDAPTTVFRLVTTEPNATTGGRKAASEALQNRRLAIAVIISWIRWVFLPLALLSAATNVPGPANVTIYLGTVAFAGLYNLVITLHSRVPADLVQPAIAFAMAGDVLVIAVLMWELAADKTAIIWATLMLAGAAAAAIYGWRGVRWYGPMIVVALAVASLAGGLLTQSNGWLHFLQQATQILGVSAIVAVIADENE